MDRDPEPIPASTGAPNSSLWVRWVTPRLFVDRRDSPRARRASDVLILIGSVLSLAFLGALALPRSGFELGIVGVLAAVPDVLDGFWRFALGLGLIGAAILLVAIVVRRRWSLLRDVVATIVAAVLLAAAVGRLVEGDWEVIWGLSLSGGDVWFPWLRVVTPIAAIATASPFLTHGFRLVGIWLCLAVVTGAMVLSAAPYLTLASAAIALIATSSVHLLFGSTKGWPELEDVALGLDALRVTVTSLALVDRQKAGVFQLTATADDGDRLVVKVYGRDAADTQFLSTVWRGLTYRGLESQFTTGRLHQVEHEAYLTLLAGRAGRAAQEVVIGGRTPIGDAILVLSDSPGVPPSSGWDEATGRSLWAALDDLHSVGIAHGHIESDTVARRGHQVLFKDFRTAVAGPESWRTTVDRIQAFVLTAVELGPEIAVAIAKDVVGARALGDLLPMLQPAVVPAASRAALRSAGGDIDRLREDTAQMLGVDPPEMERLRRVTTGSVLKGALPLVGFFALASVFAGLDLNELADSLASASWWLIVVGLLFAQVPRVGSALCTMGASPVPLPLVRLYLLQLAQSFIYLTIPNTAAKVAMNVRFLQRHGLPGGTALAVGAVDGFTSFMTQVLLLVGVLLFSSLTLDADLGDSVSSGLVTVAVIVAAVVVVGAVVVVSVARWRSLLVDRSKVYLADARDAIRGLGTPQRFGLLAGGALIAEILLAVTLGLFVVALGYRVGFPELILVYTTAILLGAVLPVPGGIGVIEGGLVLGLARAGIPEAAAFTAVILFRSATFYLPPLWGFAAFRWLERNKYL